MAEKNRPLRRADYEAMSTASLEALLRHDLQENLLDVEAISVVSHILTERMEREDPDSIPPIDLEWKSFRENYLSVRARLRRFVRRMAPKLLIVLAVLAAVAAVFCLQSRPLRTESLTEAVTLEDGRFAVNGLRAGMTREDVIAWLEEQGLPYSENGPGYYLNQYRGSDPDSSDELKSTSLGFSWISIQGNTRITELGKVNVHPTFCFSGGLLTSVDLETEPVRGSILKSVQDFRLTVLAAELAYGEAQSMNGGDWIPYDFSRPGEDRALWQGAYGSSLELCGHYFRQPGGIAGVFSRDPKAGTFIDLFEVRIHVTL